VEGGNVLHRTLVPLGAAVLALALAAPALAVRVHMRVEGAKVNLYGATEPRLTPVTGTITPPSGPDVTVNAETPFGALEAASRAGELFYRVEAFSFGPYVAQIGRLPGTATTGWVYKVNGVSPPVAATEYVLKADDRVLWYHATFGPTGGPRTLRVARIALHHGRTRTCYDAKFEDDNGHWSDARNAVFWLDGRRVRVRALGPTGLRRICPGAHWHTLSATAPGAVRSQVVRGPRRSAAASHPAGLAGRA